MTFLQQHGLDPEAIDAEALLEKFCAEMARSLRTEGDLPMLPAGFLLTSASPKQCEVLAFDVGGTNTRSARVAFDEKGTPRVQQLLRGKMPGANGKVDHEAFYAQLCEVLVPNLRAPERIGYCFSYPVTAQGKLLFWTKNIEAPDEVGRNVAEDLNAALAARNFPGCKIQILNDTVAALLAAYAHDASKTYAGYVGFILGTGTNTAYAEATENIAGDWPKGEFMPINCESSNFRDFPRSDFDNRYEAESGNGRGLWERCISGVHLGFLGTLILQMAAEEGLFSEGLASFIRARTFTNIELDNYCAGECPELFPCSEEERERLCALLRPMYHRAARFAAINIAAAALRSAAARGATSGVIRVNADGSTFWKTKAVPLKEIVCQELDALLGARGFSYELVQIEDAPLIGAAIAAYS